MKLILICILLFCCLGCRKYTDSHFYYYQVDSFSNEFYITYRDGRGITRVIRGFNGWGYGWGSLNDNEKYYINVVNLDRDRLIRAKVLAKGMVIREETDYFYIQIQN